MRHALIAEKAEECSLWALYPHERAKSISQTKPQHVTTAVLQQTAHLVVRSTGEITAPTALLSARNIVLNTNLTLTRRYQTVERVVNGTFSMQKEWMLSQGMPWDEQEVNSRLSTNSGGYTVREPPSLAL